MIRASFAHVDTWVFDLDNTLYHPSAGLFERMNPRMTAFVMRVAGVDEKRADFLRDEYWRTHGSTLAGLMAEHDMDPDDYLDHVHNIDINHLRPDPQLEKQIASLPGRKIVYTNGTSSYAKRVLAARGLTTPFDAVYGVQEAGLLPKPTAAAFAKVFEADGMTPDKAAMFEDEARNLAVPHALGMRTVHVHDEPETGEHIHHHTDDLTGFLSQLG